MPLTLAALGDLGVDGLEWPFATTLRRGPSPFGVPFGVATSRSLPFREGVEGAEVDGDRGVTWSALCEELAAELLACDTGDAGIRRGAMRLGAVDAEEELGRAGDGGGDGLRPVITTRVAPSPSDSVRA